MQEYFLILKTLLKNDKANLKVEKNGKKRLSQNAIMAISTFPIILLISAVLVYLTISIKDVNVVVSLLNTVIFGTQFFILFNMISSILNTLYNSEDNAFLSALPLRSTPIFFAKFSLVYLKALGLAMFMLLPTITSVVIAFNVVNKTIFYGIYPLIPLIIFLVPLLPLFLVTLCSMPISWISSYLKGRAIIKSLFSLLFYAILMGGYFYFIFFINTKAFNSGQETLSAGSIAGLNVLANILYPNKALISFSLGVNMGVNFGIALAVNVGFVLITIILAMLFYRKITSRKMESTERESSKKISYKKNNLTLALMKKDFMSIIRNPMMAFSNFGIFLIAPLILVMNYYISLSKMPSEIVGLARSLPGLGMCLFYTIVFLGGANALAMQAYTREGVSFFATRALPIRPTDSIKAKFLLAFICSIIVYIPIIIIEFVVYKMQVLDVVFVSIAGLLAVVGLICLSIYLDMKNGNVNWKTQADMKIAMRSNKSTLVSMLLSFLPGLPLIIMGYMLPNFIADLGEVGIKTIFWSVTFGTCFVVFLIGTIVFLKNGKSIFYKIGENKKTVPTNQFSTKKKGKFL